MTYKIVERLLVPISDGHNTTTSARPREGWKPPYEPYVPRIQREAASLIQELGEALEPFAIAWGAATRGNDAMTMGEFGAIASHHVTGVHFRRANDILSKLKDEARK